MLWPLLAVAASTAPHASRQGPPATAVVVEARASVTILSGARIRFDSPPKGDVPAIHDASVTTNGTRQPARLVEFE